MSIADIIAIDDRAAVMELVEDCKSKIPACRALAVIRLQELINRNDTEFGDWVLDQLNALRPVGSVYVLVNESRTAIKIGWSSDIEKRIETLNAATWERLVCVAHCLAHRNIETRLHRWASRYRIRGEWYRFSESLLDAVVSFVNMHKDNANAG